VHAINAEADSDEDTIRISVDSKATIKIGDFSRKGKSRGKVAVQAADHDMNTKQKVAPGGILEVLTGQAFLFFTDNHKTCLLYTSPSPRDVEESRMPSSA